MDVITPVSADEVLVAQGMYSFTLNGEPTSIREAWQIHRSPYHFDKIRVDRDSRALDGTRVLVEAMRKGGSIEWFAVKVLAAEDGIAKELSAHFLVGPAGVRVSRTLKRDETARLDMIPVPPNTVISPLMCVFQGAVIAQVALQGKGEPVPVFIPNIRERADAPQLLTGLVDYCRAEWLSMERATIAGRNLSARVYSYTASDYNEAARFYLNSEDMLLRYRYPQSPELVWDVALSEYVRF